MDFQQERITTDFSPGLESVNLVTGRPVPPKRKFPEWLLPFLNQLAFTGMFAFLMLSDSAALGFIFTMTELGLQIGGIFYGAIAIFGLIQLILNIKKIWLDDNTSVGELITNIVDIFANIALMAGGLIPALNILLGIAVPSVMMAMIPYLFTLGFALAAVSHIISLVAHTYDPEYRSLSTSSKAVDMIIFGSKALLYVGLSVFFGLGMIGMMSTGIFMAAGILGGILLAGLTITQIAVKHHREKVAAAATSTPPLLLNPQPSYGATTDSIPLPVVQASSLSTSSVLSAPPHVTGNFTVFVTIDRSNVDTWRVPIKTKYIYGQGQTSFNTSLTPGQTYTFTVTESNFFGRSSSAKEVQGIYVGPNKPAQKSLECIQETIQSLNRQNKSGPTDLAPALLTILNDVNPTNTLRIVGTVNEENTQQYPGIPIGTPLVQGTQQGSSAQSNTQCNLLDRDGTTKQAFYIGQDQLPSSIATATASTDGMQNPPPLSSPPSENFAAGAAATTLPPPSIVLPPNMLIYPLGRPAIENMPMAVNVSERGEIIETTSQRCAHFELAKGINKYQCSKLCYSQVDNSPQWGELENITIQISPDNSPARIVNPPVAEQQPASSLLAASAPLALPELLAGSAAASSSSGQSTNSQVVGNLLASNGIFGTARTTLLPSPETIPNGALLQPPPQQPATSTTPAAGLISTGATLL